jgi:uncharacterized circularly permuted ATP-grasp superfamily protein/uncharacterized alpha-E superfamily protein
MNTSTPANNSTASFLLQGYGPPSGSFDEMTSDHSGVRPQWQTFLESLEKLGLQEFTHRWDEARQLLRVNGVTYNLHGDKHGLERPWQLDPIPLLISEQEARGLESGLSQRARMLEAMLRDLYGPQQLLRDGVLPSELVLANPSFLRPCHGIRLPLGQFLHLLAFDLARDAHGTILVISQRAQAPSGAGYALENRIVMDRMLPELFRACNVQRLALFFRTFRDTLRALAQHNRDNPRVVLLTPGPLGETYFEHAYLARYLGYTLVEGGDLTVRDNRVFLKVLDGLRPVDVVLRRLDDNDCDPLELRPDALAGVPGLVQAVRSGNVAVANSLGSGLAASPGFIPFLPMVCRRLLGEELTVASVPTYWCGEPAALDHVLGNLRRMVVKSAYPSRRSDPVFGSKLSAIELQEMADRIKAQPSGFVGQEQIELSTTPVMTAEGVQPRHLVVRTFFTPGEPSFVMMPGALTRYAATPESSIVALQGGGGSKDTWVLTSAPVSSFSLLKMSTSPVEISRGGNDLPSRAADNLFWLGRYAERSEGLVRLLRGIFMRLIDKPAAEEFAELSTLLQVLAITTHHAPPATQDAPLTAQQSEQELHALVYDRERAGSLAFNLRAIYRTAGSVRDRISLDMWRVIASLEMTGTSDVPPPQEQAWLGDVLDLLNRHVITLAAFGGLAAESMTRGHGWRFLDMGRKMERALHTVRLLRGGLTQVTAGEAPLLEAILEIADSLMTFRRRYLSQVHTAAVLDLLIADESNPRSLVCQLESLRENAERLPAKSEGAGRSLEQRIALALVSSVQLADVEKLVVPTADGRRPTLGELLTHLEVELCRFADAVSHHFLAHLQISRHLAGNMP